MKKNLFIAMLAVFGIFAAASCTHDELDTIQDSDVAQVTFSLGVENAVGTKAISDGKTANKLVYAVYNSNGEALPVFENSAIQKTETIGDITSNPHQVTITLAKGQKYQIAFWAQNADCDSYNTTDLKAVQIDYTGVNNDETRDAFFKTVELTVTRSESVPVVLKRPFAQINVGVTEGDWDAASASGIDIKNSKAVIKNAANQINLLTGAASGSVEVIYDLATIPANVKTSEDPIAYETLEVETDANRDGKEQYRWLSMSYVLPNDGSEDGNSKTTMESLAFTFVPISGNSITLTEGLNSVPVQRNWRTNILGQLLTGNITFSITIDPIPYDGDYNGLPFEDVDGISYDAATKTFTISNIDGFEWFVNRTNTLNVKSVDENTNTNGGNFKGFTVKLAQDINLEGKTITPIGTVNGFLGTFDGGNNTISNLTVNVTEDGKSAGLFATARVVKNLRLSNVNISGHFKAGAIVGDGICAQIENCHVDGGSITSTPNSEKKEANNVGGITGYLSSEPTAYIKNCSVKNLTITAYRDLGGLVGKVTAEGNPIVSGNTVDNVNVIADNIMTDYGEPGKETNAGEVVGRNMHNNLDLKSNTVNNVTVKVNTLASIAQEGGIVTLKSDIETQYLNVFADFNLNIEENVTFTSGTPVDYGVIVRGGTTTINSKGEINSKGGGIAIVDGANVIFNSGKLYVNTTSTSGRYLFYLTGTGSTATINGGSFSWSPTLNQKRAYIYAGAGTTVYVKGGTFGKASTRDGYTAGILGEGTVIITGGSFGFDPTKWVAEGYTAVKKDGNWYVIPGKVDSEQIASNNEELSNIIQSGKTTIALTPGTYIIPDDAKGKALTIIGTGNPEDTKIATQDDGSYEGCDYSLDGASVTFENISINTNSATYTGYARLNATYKNCVINGTYTLYGDSVFENCTFNVSGDVYNIWTWGAPTAKFDKCTFNSDGKAVLLYGTVNTKLTIENSVFYDKGGLTDKKAAIEIGNDYNKSYELIVNNTIVNGYEINDKGINTGTTLWGNKNSMGTDKLNVVVDGVDVY